MPGYGAPESESFPHVARVGAYALFAVCAFSTGTLAGALFKSAGAASWVAGNASSIITFAIFVALRDMTKRAA